MPGTAKSDADCIQSGYEDAVGGLFKQLFDNLVGQPDGPGDQRYLAMFTTGYNMAKHAKALALGVVGGPAPAVAAAKTRRRATKPKRR
jgi:hypothetical protein